MGTNRRYADRIDSRVNPRVPWEPILDCTEIEPGLWAMSESSVAKPYAQIRFVRRGPELGYRVDAPTGLIGYYRSLKSAALNAWRQTIAPPQGQPPSFPAR